MQTQEPSKSKPKNKYKPHSQAIKTLKVNSNRLALDDIHNKQSHQSFLNALSRQIQRHQPISLNIALQLFKVLQFIQESPNLSFKLIMKIYEKNPELFFKRKLQNNQNKQSILFIISLIANLVRYFQQFPFTDRQKIIHLYQQFLKWIHDQKQQLFVNELILLTEVNLKIWAIINSGEDDRIIQNGLYFFIKLSVKIGQRQLSDSQVRFAQQSIGDNIKQMIKYLQKKVKITNEMLGQFISFFQDSFHLLIKISQRPDEILPLFDIASLIFSSRHCQFYKQIFNFAFATLRLTLQQNKHEENETIKVEAKLAKECDQKVTAIFLCSSLLKFSSIFTQFQQKAYYKRQVLFLVLLVFKQQISRLIDELQKMDKLLIKPSILRGMFMMVVSGNTINHRPIISQIVAKIYQIKQLSPYLQAFQSMSGPMSTLQNGQNINSRDVTLKMIQKSLFDIMYRIQKTLCHYNLQMFMDLYISYPLTFRSQYFIQNLFQNQHQNIVLQFMLALTSKWLMVDLKLFDYSFFLLHFLRKCVRQDKINIIGLFLKNITVDELLKVNLFIFKLSFEDQKKKYSLPQGNCIDKQFANLTSAGFAEKIVLINKLMPNFSQQLMWKQPINYLYPSQNYILVKAFYQVLNFQIQLVDQNLQKVESIIRMLESAIDQQHLEELFSIFQLIFCILFKKIQTSNESSIAIIQKCLRSILKIIIEKHKAMFGMYEVVCERRRTALGHVLLSVQMIADNMKYLQKAKRMNSYFIRSVLKFIDHIQLIEKLIDHSYQKLIQIIFILNKDCQFPGFHAIRCLSNFCSQKYFSNMLTGKLQMKIINKQNIPISNLLLLREVINNCIKKYEFQQVDNNLSLGEMSIIKYYQHVLGSKIGVMNERQLLKSKLIAVESLFQFKQFLQLKQGDQAYKYIFNDFKFIFNHSLKHIIIDLAKQNPQLVSKYERELILHLRITVIAQIIKSYQTCFQIMESDELFSFLFELCFDKYVQIRYQIINLLTSRFKYDINKSFYQQKYFKIALLTVMSIFDTNPVLKTIARKTIQTIKSVQDDVCCMGLTVLLFSIKHILTYIANNLSRGQYNINLDYFLKHFDKIWLNRKDFEYFAYAFACKFIEEKKMQFIIHYTSYKSYIQSYITAKERSDFIMQSQIKDYLRKQWDFSFQFPPDEEPTSKETLIARLMRALPLRIFAKLKQLISQKPKVNRILKYKKECSFNLHKFQSSRIIKVQQYSQQIDQRIILSI